MAMSFCTKCGCKLADNAKFCAACGNKIQNVSPASSVSQTTQKPVQNNQNIPSTKEKKKPKIKLIIILCSIALGIIIIGIVAFALINYFSLQDSANKSKNNVNVHVGNTEISQKLGNLPGNTTEGSFSVYKNNALFFVNSTGVYKTKTIKNKIKNNEDCFTLASKSYKCAQMHNEDLYTIDCSNNQVVKFKNAFNEYKPEWETFMKFPKEESISQIAISNDYIYIAILGNGHMSLCCKKLDGNKENAEMYTEAADNVWLYASENCVCYAVSNGQTWTVRKSKIENGLPGKLEIAAQGSSKLADIAFTDDKIYYVESGTSSANKIIDKSYTGNKREIQTNKNINKILLIGNAIFAQTSDNKFIWFNTDSPVTHDINNNEFSNKKAVSMNVNDHYFCVQYDDNTIVTTDINELN